MGDNSRVRNLAVLLALVLVYTVPAIFISHDRMLDLVSLFMLIFACSSIYLIGGEAWYSFWQGHRDRAALGLFGLTAIFISVILMRSYGILTRNVPGSKWLEETQFYSAMVFMQFAGLWLFSRGATSPTVKSRPARWGQLVVGIIIGSLIATSKVLEPALMMLWKLVGRLF